MHVNVGDQVRGRAHPSHDASAGWGRRANSQAEAHRGLPCSSQPSCRPVEPSANLAVPGILSQACPSPSSSSNTSCSFL